MRREIVEDDLLGAYLVEKELSQQEYEQSGGIKAKVFLHLRFRNHRPDPSIIVSYIRDDRAEAHRPLSPQLIALQFAAMQRGYDLPEVPNGELVVFPEPIRYEIEKRYQEIQGREVCRLIYRLQRRTEAAS